jgi:hypothetical protein
MQSDFWAAASGAAVDCGLFPVFQRLEYFTDVLQHFHQGLRLVWLLQLYVFFWVAHFDEEFADSFAVVSLQHYLTVF